MKRHAIYKYRHIEESPGISTFFKKILQSVAIFENSPIFVMRRKILTLATIIKCSSRQLLYEKKGTDHPGISDAAINRGHYFISSFLFFPVHM